MYGLSIRWSLSGTPAGTEQALRDYVREESVERFRGMPGLHQKTWEMAERGFFSGVYVWASAEARASFLDAFRANPSRVTQLIGSEPELVQEWDLVAVAIGAEGPLGGSG
jgi:hypothetical protein